MDKDITKALLRDKHIVGYVMKAEMNNDSSTIPPTIDLTIQINYPSKDFLEDLFSDGLGKVAIFKLR